MAKNNKSKEQDRAKTRQSKARPDRRPQKRPKRGRKRECPSKPPSKRDEERMNSTPPAKAAPARGQVRASSGAHASKEDSAEEPLSSVREEIFRNDHDPDCVIPSLDRTKIRPRYAILEMDPDDLVVCQSDKSDGVLLSGVAASFDELGIIIPPVAVRRSDQKLQVLLGQGRTRVLWARDRGVKAIRVIEVELNGVPLWTILREVAIEDLRRHLSYERFIEWYDELESIIDLVHSHETARRKLIADAKRSATMLARRSGLNTDRHKILADSAESWQKRKFGDPVAECKSEAALAQSKRFKKPLTVSLFFRRAMSESTARRILRFRKALRSKDKAIKRFDMPRRLAGLGEGEYSADGIERKLHSIERIEQLKKKLRQHTALTSKDIDAAVRWILKRIKCQNLWIWPSVNLGFGMLRRLGELKDHLQQGIGLTAEEASAYIYGEYPGADVPLNLMTHLTRPGDLVVDSFAGSGASKCSARHFLDPRWPDKSGRYIWWNHWFDAFSGRAGGDLNKTVFPPDYWEVDHSRKCLQFDVDPNPLALKEYGHDFIIQHDVTEGITDRIVQLVGDISPDGAQLIYLDPPYLSQADYVPVEPTSADDEPPSLQTDRPKLRVARWARHEAALGRARAKALSKAAENNLCRMSIPRYVQVMARLLIECDKILGPKGRIALFMGTDAREGTIFDPAHEIFKALQDSFERLDQVPFELDREGPLYHQVWVPSHGYGLGPQIAWKRSEGQLANVHRYIWILRRRDKGSCERLA